MDFWMLGIIAKNPAKRTDHESQNYSFKKTLIKYSDYAPHPKHKTQHDLAYRVSTTESHTIAKTCQHHYVKGVEPQSWCSYVFMVAGSQ